MIMENLMGASGVERINVSGERHGCFAVIQMTDLQIIYTILVSFVLVFFCSKPMPPCLQNHAENKNTLYIHAKSSMRTGFFCNSCQEF
jgi:hypothetical protein